MPAPPGLEERFRAPPGFRWGSFTTRDGNHIRFGSVSPPQPQAVIVCLQGLSEFTEKYFEFARDLLARDYAFWMMDWKGQALSQRDPRDPMRRHAQDFIGDVGDLDEFIGRIIRPALPPGMELALFGHSMGGNIGLRYLAAHPGVFACAGFTAPMIGISPIGRLPGMASLLLTSLFSSLSSFSYIPTGGREWNPDMRAHPRRDIFSSDPVRKQLHNAWFAAEPALQVGNVTFGWLHAANHSCALLQKPGFAAKIATPCLLALAGDDTLVLNSAARRMAQHMPQAQILELPGAKHEIIMERDEIRGAFLRTFFALVDQTAG
jgi:lysophospholipase